MFDFNLTDVSATLCVGVISILLIGYLYYISRKFFSPDFDSDGFITEIKKELDKERKNNGYLLIGVIWIYCVGFFVGDLTGRMTDSDTAQTSPFLKMLQNVNQMKKQEETRLEAFIDSANAWKLTPLGYSALNTPKVVKNANMLAGTNISIELCFVDFCDGKRLSSQYRRSFKRFIHQIYYTGKNWCYAKDGEPIKELKTIQNRIDMARSTVFLIDVGIIILSVMVFIKLLYTIFYLTKFKRKADHEKYCKNWYKNQTHFFGPRRITDKIFHFGQFHVLGLLFLMLFFSKQCFEIGQSNYTRRACGYYIGDINRAEHLQINEGNPKTTVSTENVKH